MATLSGNKIKDTYQSLVKFTDNGNITVGAKQLTDGFGNNSPLYLSTTQVGIGVTPESGLNLHVYGDAKIGSNLTVIGNLVVEGSTTTVGTDTLTVKDPLIVLANNNTSTDAVDIGFYGKYTPSGTTLYSGLFREALTGKYRLFKDLQVEPTTTVNTSGTGYAQATLIAALEGNVTGNVTGNLTGNVTGGTISGTTGTFGGDVEVNGGDLSITSSTGLASVELGGASGGYIDIKAPESDDYDMRFIVSQGGNEITTASGDLKINTANTLALTIDTSQDATFAGGVSATTGTFSGQVTIPETPTADTHAASKGYVDAAVEGQDTLAEILAIGNTTGGTDIAITAGDKITNFTSTGIDDNAASTAITIDSSQDVTFASDISFADDNKILLGDGDDVEMYWDSNGAFVIDVAPLQQGILIVSNTLRASSGTFTYIDFNQAELEFFSLGNEKFKVHQTGVTVTGVASITGNTTIGGDLAVDTDTLFVDVSEDSVGIGLTNPSDYSADELVISVPDDSGMTLVSGTTDTAYIRFADGTAAADQANFISHDHDTNTLTVFSQAKVSIGILEAEVAYFTDTAFYVDKPTTIDDTLTVDGKIAIDTNIPKGKLDITGNSGLISSSLGQANLSSINLRVTNTVNRQGQIVWSSDIPSFTFGLGAIGMVMTTAGTGTNTGTADMIFSTKSGTSDAASTERMRIDSSGNVTVNSGNVQLADSNKRITVDGSDIRIWQRSAANIQFLTNDLERMRIDSSGQVQVKATSGGDLLLYSTDTSLGSNQLIGRLGFYKSDASGSGVGVSSSIQVRSDSSIGANSYMSFHTDGGSGQQEAERMRIDRTGNVGIGTTSPDFALDIEGLDSGVQLQIGRTNTSAGSTWMGSDSNGFHLGVGAYGSGNSVTDPNGFTVDTSGNVGIGTTSLGRGLTIDKSNEFASLEIIKNNTGNQIAYLGTGSSGASDLGILQLKDSNTIAVQIYSGGDSWFNGGNVGIGTTPKAWATAGGTKALQISTRTALWEAYNGTYLSNNMYYDGSEKYIESDEAAQISLGGDGTIYFRNAVSGTADAALTWNERMRITSGGDVEITGGYSSSQSFQSTGSLRVSSNSTATSGNVALELMNDATGTRYLATFTNLNGVVGSISTYSSATSYNTSSDYRLKENVVSMTGALDRVSQLKPSRFNFIADADKTVDGFLAHEVQEIVPEAITGEKDAMRTEEYEVTPAVYEDVVHPAEEAVYETIEHPAVEEELDDEGNIIVEGKEAYTEEVLVTEAKEEWTEKVLVSEKVMGTREVPDYQGIDQSKLVPLLVGAIQEQQQLINDLKSRIETLENN